MRIVGKTNVGRRKKNNVEKLYLRHERVRRGIFADTDRVGLQDY